ncbi:hypothetical protein Gogos_020970, partial [Gossypium gossypioides]|nr:hypothetical protein [Gossypium gossypioides]
LTLLKGSKKLLIHEVFTSVQDSGSLSGYIRTYVFVRFSSPYSHRETYSPKLNSVLEDNAIVRIWSEKVQLEKGDSLAKRYVSELWDYTRISVTQNSLQELNEIWDQWNDETKQLFYSNYGDLPYLLNIKVDEQLFRALAQYWNPAYSCFTFGKVDLVPIVEEYTALLHCLRLQVDKAYSRAAFVPAFWKKLMNITGMSE